MWQIVADQAMPLQTGIDSSSTTRAVEVERRGDGMGHARKSRLWKRPADRCWPGLASNAANAPWSWGGGDDAAERRVVSVQDRPKASCLAAGMTRGLAEVSMSRSSP